MSVVNFTYALGNHDGWSKIKDRMRFERLRRTLVYFRFDNIAFSFFGELFFRNMLVSSVDGWQKRKRTPAKTQKEKPQSVCVCTKNVERRRKPAGLEFLSRLPKPWVGSKIHSSTHNRVKENCQDTSEFILLPPQKILMKRLLQT